MSKVFCIKCKHILGPPYVKKSEALCCASVTYRKNDRSDWYEEDIRNMAEGHVLCSQRNVLNQCTYYEEREQDET